MQAVLSAGLHNAGLVDEPYEGRASGFEKSPMCLLSWGVEDEKYEGACEKFAPKKPEAISYSVSADGTGANSAAKVYH